MAPTYDQILARNLRAARARLGPLGQESVARRMNALGFGSWLRQTVSSAEKGRRRLAASEIFALALVLETSVPVLLTPMADDEGVAFPGGTLRMDSGAKLVMGINVREITWDGDVPVFPAAGPSWAEIIHPAKSEG